MPKYFAVALALAVSSLGFAQSSAHSSDSGMKHYRLTFVVDSGQGESGKQSFMLDVPVAPGKMGAARVNLISASEGDTQSVVQQLLECSNVHASPHGSSIAYRVAI